MLEHGGYLEWGTVPTNLKLYQGKTLIDENEFSSDFQWVEVPAGTKPYRLVLDASRPGRRVAPVHPHAHRVELRLQSNEADDFVPFTLMQLDYGLRDRPARRRQGGHDTQDQHCGPDPNPAATGTGTVTLGVASTSPMTTAPTGSGSR